MSEPGKGVAKPGVKLSLLELYFRVLKHKAVFFPRETLKPAQKAKITSLKQSVKQKPVKSVFPLFKILFNYWPE